MSIQAAVWAGGIEPEWTLQDRLRKAREVAGLDQAGLGRRTGISRGSVSNYENGTTQPRRPVLLAWAMACGDSADTEAAIYIDASGSFLNDINPGNTVMGVVIFDMPKGTPAAIVELHDSPFSGGVKVRLA